MDSEDQHAKLRRLRAALAKGEADIAAGRATTLENDREIDAFFARVVATHGSDTYRATREELKALDEAEVSGIATEAEVEAAFRSFRSSEGKH